MANGMAFTPWLDILKIGLSITIVPYSILQSTVACHSHEDPFTIPTFSHCLIPIRLE